MAPPNSDSVEKDSSFGNWFFAGLFMFVLALFIIGVWFTDIGKKCVESFKDAFTKPSLKDLDIVMFINPECTWCNKQLEVLKSAGVMDQITVVDKTTDSGLVVAKSFGVDGIPVPSFVSRKNRTTTYSFKDSVSKLSKDLSGPESSAMTPPQRMSPGPDHVKKMGINLFTRETCGWCVKTKEELAGAGLVNSVNIIDVETPMGAKLYEETFGEPAGPVPMWASSSSGKTEKGYVPIELIFDKLS